MLGKKQERNVDTSRAFLLLLLLLRSDEFCYKWLVFPRCSVATLSFFLLSLFSLSVLSLSSVSASFPSARWRIVLNRLILSTLSVHDLLFGVA